MKKGSPWPQRDLDCLARLREGKKAKWAEIAAIFPGRTIGACQLAYHGIKSRRLRDQQRALAQGLVANVSTASRLLAVPPIAAPTRVMPPPSPSTMRTSMLRADAELRARIELLGATGGLLGDPMPGRSALDQKRAGIVDPPAAPDRRYPERPRAPITLATEPAMITPVRIQLSRAKGFNLQDASRALNGLAAVNIARPGPWGNPFIVGIDGARPHCIALFCDLLDGKYAMHARAQPTAQRAFVVHVAEQLKSLKGKNLACWCGPGMACHGDPLLARANRPALCEAL
jgi:hypothetical protein